MSDRWIAYATTWSPNCDECDHISTPDFQTLFHLHTTTYPCCEVLTRGVDQSFVIPDASSKSELSIYDTHYKYCYWRACRVRYINVV